MKKIKESQLEKKHKKLLYVLTVFMVIMLLIDLAIDFKIFKVSETISNVVNVLYWIPILSTIFIWFKIDYESKNKNIFKKIKRRINGK